MAGKGRLFIKEKEGHILAPIFCCIIEPDLSFERFCMAAVSVFLGLHE